VFVIFQKLVIILEESIKCMNVTHIFDLIKSIEVTSQ